ncbi:hypothetical protein L3X38_026960 [Prunus dulcis]|uniref:Uncharacterized protein n=1 Tax=Prunus dulcis TaxID=3755 RepID=A0AAD4YZY5_PRUDU|nr:hypothetical protein L3X38_026960 [Prunus dulcis]
MGSLHDRLGKVERTHNPLVPSFFEDKIPLLYTNELLEVTIVGDTRSLKIALYEGLTDPYDRLDSFLYSMEGPPGGGAMRSPSVYSSRPP